LVRVEALYESFELSLEEVEESIDLPILVKIEEVDFKVLLISELVIELFELLF
jgi:hypothetical protein